MSEDEQRTPKRPSDEAFERLYRAHRRAVYRFVLRDLGDPQEAEDVTQIAFLDAYRALSRGSRPDAPRPWLYTIARNASRRRFRRERPDEVPLEDSVTLVDPQAADAAAREIVAAVLALSQRHREVLLLREVHGLSAAETARELDTSIPSVEMALFRARREVRSALESAGFAPERRGPAALVAGLLPARLVRLALIASPGATASSVGVVGLGALVVALGGASGAVRPDRARIGIEPASIAPSVVQPAVRHAETSRGERASVDALVLVPDPPQYTPAKNPDYEPQAAQQEADTQPGAGPAAAAPSAAAPTTSAPLHIPANPPVQLPKLPPAPPPQLPAPPLAVPAPTVPPVPALPAAPAVPIVPPAQLP
jgi:RNA polymerase sigma factor (sigma-70 family)